ncbi:MAG: ATP-binding cassette domain-containing protein, partial [Gemmatimonadota bacterium]
YEVRGDRYRARRDWILSMANLEDARSRRTGQLPLGWKQRLALGCAVLHEPAVLFLDEPTSGVDPAARRAFWDLIYGMAEAGTTILVSTHYMEEAEYCGRVALMNRGRLIALDRPASLRSSLAEPILEVRTDGAARAVEALAGADAVIEAAMFGRRLHVAARRALKYDIGYMSQLFSLYLDLTVEENIELFAGLYEVRGDRYRARRDWILSMANLEDARSRRTGQLPLGWKQRLRSRRTGQLPLGWKQRLALGCAVLHEPAVLFLDEPTSGVDPAARRTFWDLIYEMAESGTTILVSTHYMEEAEYCGRVALMNRGRLIALDRPASLRSSLAEPILEVRTDEAARAVEALAGADAVIEAAMFGRRLHVAAEDENRARAAITRRLDAAGLSLESIERIQPSLEDVFVSMVRREGGTVAE